MWSMCLVTQSCPTLCNPWTVARQAPLSMGFSSQEYWSGCHFILQGIFQTQGSNPHLLRWQADSLPLSYLGSSEFYVKYILIKQLFTKNKKKKRIQTQELT